MGTHVLKGTGFTFGTQEYDDHIKGVTLTYEAEQLDDTVMGDDTRSNTGGLKTWQMEVEFLTEFSATMDEHLFDNVGTTATAKMRITATSVASATNPEYSGAAMLQNYPAVGQSVGELAGGTATVLSAGTLTRVTAT